MRFSYYCPTCSATWTVKVHEDDGVMPDAQCPYCVPSNPYIDAITYRPSQATASNTTNVTETEAMN